MGPKREMISEEKLFRWQFEDNLKFSHRKLKENWKILKCFSQSNILMFYVFIYFKSTR